MTLIVAIMFMGGCGKKVDKKPVNVSTEIVPIQQSVPNYQTTASTVPEPSSAPIDTRKVDTNTPQGQASINGAIDHQMKYLDATLNDLDNSMKNIGNL